MVRHIVSWNFRPEITPERRAELCKELSEKFPTLVGVIPGLLKVEVGMPPLDSSNCDLALYNEFEDEASLHAYSVHPAHVAIASIVRDNCIERRCVDIIGD